MNYVFNWNNTCKISIKVKESLTCGIQPHLKKNYLECSGVVSSLSGLSLSSLQNIKIFNKINKNKRNNIESI